MTECAEVADSIWRARSVLEGNGQNVTVPIRTIDDAITVARYWMPGESETVISNVAETLLSKADQSRGRLAKLRSKR